MKILLKIELLDRAVNFANHTKNFYAVNILHEIYGSAQYSVHSIHMI